MPTIAFVFILISSVFVGIMAILRKQYQIINGTTMSVAVFFTLFVCAIGTIVTSVLNGGIYFSMMSIGFAVVYALISIVTTSVCIYATNLGNLTTLMLWALLGTLVLPFVFGVLIQPNENKLTIYKISGFLAAIACITIGFFNNKNHKKDDLKFKLLCAIVFFSNGSALIIFNLKNKLCTDISNLGFIAEYMLFSVIIATVYLIIFQLKSKETAKDIKSALNKKSVIIMFSYACMILVSEILMLKCSGILPLGIQAPIAFASPIITTAVIDYYVYKIRINITNVLQLVFASLCCISFMLDG